MTQLRDEVRHLQRRRDAVSDDRGFQGLEVEIDLGLGRQRQHDGQLLFGRAGRQSGQQCLDRGVIRCDHGIGLRQLQHGRLESLDALERVGADATVGGQRGRFWVRKALAVQIEKYLDGSDVGQIVASAAPDTG